MTVLIHMTIPRLLTERFATPADVKAYLVEGGVWPAGITVERWRIGTTTPGYEVEIEVHVPLPRPVPGGASHGP